jgi:invasion protein IalB
MNESIVSVLARVAARPFATAAAASVATAIAASAAYAQQPPASTPPAKPAQTAPKPAPAKPPAKPALAPAQAPSPAPQQNTQAPQAEPLPPIVYSHWIKFCPTSEDASAKGGACFTGIDGRLESGMLVVALVAIEPEGEQQKILRATLPVGMNLQSGTRLIIDQGQPLTAPYMACFNTGCVSDYELNADTLAKLKKAQSVLVQGISYGGGPVTIPLPVADFAKAFDGPPTDPKVLEARQKEIEELQRKAKEAQQKIEGQQPPAQPGAAPAPPAAAAPAAPANKP